MERTPQAEFEVAVKDSNFVNFTEFLGARNNELFPKGPARFKILETILHYPQGGQSVILHALSEAQNFTPPKNHQVSAGRPKTIGKDHENLLYNGIRFAKILENCFP